jgi:hypothetical protein
VDCYVDADFSGSLTAATSQDPNSVRSRSGYVITYVRCPILWSSELQTEIALSITEAEYISLSQSLCDLIPIWKILQELCATYGLSISAATAHSTVFEDTKGCINLIAALIMRPCSHHIAIKYHHF